MEVLTAKVQERRSAMRRTEKELKSKFGEQVNLKRDASFASTYNEYWDLRLQEERLKFPGLPMSSGKGVRAYQGLVEKGRSLSSDFRNQRLREGRKFTAQSVFGANNISFGQPWRQRESVTIHCLTCVCH